MIDITTLTIEQAHELLMNKEISCFVHLLTYPIKHIDHL